MLIAFILLLMLISSTIKTIQILDLQRRIDVLESKVVTTRGSAK